MTLRLSTIVLLLFAALLGPACSEPAPTPSATPTATPSPSPDAKSDDDDKPSTNAFGPTITNPATLTNVGLPEFEFYYEVQNNAPGIVKQRQAQFLIKYAFSKRFMVTIGSNGLVRNTTALSSTEQFADPIVAFKWMYKPPAPKQSAQAFEISYKAPLGNANLGIDTGRPDYQLFWLYSRDLADVHLDANVWVGNLGASDGTRRLVLNQSAAVSIPVAPNLTYQGEVYHFGGNGPIDSIVSTLHALGWQVSNSFYLSAGVDVGLNQAAPRISYVLGTCFFIGGGSKPAKASAFDALPSPTLRLGR